MRTLTYRYRPPQEADHLAAQLRREFAAALQQHLTLPATVRWTPGLPITCWLDEWGYINHACVFTIGAPDGAASPDLLVLRISINLLAFDGERAIRRRMGWPDISAFPPEPKPAGWHYELSLLPRQLLRFAPWIAELALAKAKHDGSLLTKPPAPCCFWGGRSLHCAYAWTQAAWRRTELRRQQNLREWRRRSNLA